ncbi:MAG: type II secretion system F family protein [Halobacteriaceae archaeon]
MDDTTASGYVETADRALYALFARHVDERRHERDRKRYRATTVTTSFEVYLARVYGLSWVVAFLATAWVALGLWALSPATHAAVGRALAAHVPAALPRVPWAAVALTGAVLAGATGKRATVRVGGAYLRWAGRARRAAIERTLPGAVRYLHALASGSDDEAAMLRKVATQGAYGETAVAFRTVLNRAALTGSLDRALRVVARDTPAQDSLAPFLLKFREYADQGNDALADYLRLEGRMLGRRQRRERRQAEGMLELLAELFIVLLVLPTLLVIVLTVLGVLAPGLARPVATPVGPVSVRVLLVYGSVAFVLAVGALTAWLVAALRPPNVVTTVHAPDEGLALVRRATTNPANAARVGAPLLGAGALAWALGARPANAALVGYVVYAVPVGAVALRRAHLDEAKDREIKDFVHAVSGHVSLGRPFPEAVDLVAREVDLGALDGDVADLAFDLGVTGYEGDVRASALDAFVERVGTPLAEQTVGLVTGALDVGADPETVFDALQAEVGRLYHEKRALRATMLAYVAVGWTTAILVVGVLVAVNLYVLASFDQLATVSASMQSGVLDPSAIDPARDRYRFYLVGQATMLACGWFAGYATRGRYEALLHSGLLVAVAWVIFAGVGAA